MNEARAARRAELVLVTAEGVVVGQLPPVAVDLPWWPEVESVVRAVREQFGIDVTILRLLESEHPQPPGGKVTYLAEVADGVRGEPTTVTLDEQPLRQPYARPGGPRRDLDWAESVLGRHGLAMSGRPQQIKTWNLSSLWRIPLCDHGSSAAAASVAAAAGAAPLHAAWLKVVPPFFAHEGRLIAAMPAGANVPPLLGHDDEGRTLLAELPGEDLFHASLQQRRSMIELLVELQRHWAVHTGELLALGLADYRRPSLQRGIVQAFERTRSELGAADVEALLELIEGLPDRFDELDSAGLPDTLVHGDFHSGNVRGAAGQLTLIDWGDSGVGHPLLDHAAFLDRAPEPDRTPLAAHWHELCRRAWPGSDPARAWACIAPLAAARQAIVYLRFLDGIEPSEHVYHRSDPAAWLRRAAELMRASPPIQSARGSGVSESRPPE
jgi:phosphotransferase family enzyme